MSDFEITGVQQLTELSRRFRTAGETGLRRELHRGLDRAVKPARRAAKKNARRILPNRGGLADRVARSRMDTSVRTRGGESRALVLATSRDSLKSIDKGRVRHPVFGNRSNWVTQPVRPGWFTTPMQENRPAALRELQRVMDRVQRQL